MIDLRERVAIAIAASDDQPLRGSLRRQGYMPPQDWGKFSPTMQTVYLNNADAAIIAVIEALAAEAESHITGQQPIGGQRRFQWARTAQFLRSHLPAGRDGEAGDAQ